MLAPVLDPAHRMADLQRDRRDGDVFRHDAVLAAEAAADVGRDDADLVLRQAERLGKRRSASRGRPGSRDRPRARRCDGPNRPARRGIRATPSPGGSCRNWRRRRIGAVLSDSGSPSITVAGDVGVVRPVVEHARAVRRASPRRHRRRPAVPRARASTWSARSSACARVGCMQAAMVCPT